MSCETPVGLPRAPAAPPFALPRRWHGGLTAAYASERGNGHARNEDCCSHVPSGDRPGFCGVADGVGGGAHGEIASSVLLAHCAQAPEKTYSNPQRLVEWLTHGDARVRQAIALRTDRSGAATLAAAWFPSESTAYLLNVGDCRVYRLKPHGTRYAIERLTVDQTYASLAQEPPPNGSPEDPARMVGAGAVGVPPVVKTQVRSRELLLLCSDGVHKFVSDDEIADVVSNGLREGSPLKAICNALVGAAKRNGSHDDASALLVLRRPWLSLRWIYGCVLAALLLCFISGAFAETQSVIDPVAAPAPQKPPAPDVTRAPQADAAVKRERRRAAEEQRKRANAEARAQAAETEAAELRAAQQAQAAAREAAAKEAARKAASARAAAAQAAAAKAAQARIAAQKDATRKNAARKEALRQAAEREAAARQAAAKEAAMREAAAREGGAREAAAREAIAREAAAREAAMREAAAREAAAREAAAREAMREAAAREVAAREAAAREAAREVAAREAAAREAARLAAAREAAAGDARAQPFPRSVYRDCADCPEIVWIPKGEATLGLSAAPGGPRYVARMSQTLAVGRFKVSYAEWNACVADGGCRRRPDDAGYGRGRQPVTNVSWEDAQNYAAWLARRTGKPYRLLTGAEWEDAAKTWPEVYDMHGSVSEWVENCYQYRDARNGGKMWTLECTNQTVRGGNAQGSNGMTRVARSFAPMNYHDSRIGFRVARTE